MAKVDGVFVVLTIIFSIAILVLAIFIYLYSRNLSSCEKNESKYCYSLVCPGPVNSQDKCIGYAQRKDSQGNLSCASSGATITQTPPS